MKVAISTWNSGQTLHENKSLGLWTWFEDGDSSMTNGDREQPEAPSIYAIGFQESVPLPDALFGSPSSQLLFYEQDMRTEIQKHASRYTHESESAPEYNLVRKVVMGAIALFVYASEAISSQIEDVYASSARCGPLFMSNKGAVGVRFRLKQNATVWTFVSAHLAAHDYNVERRNQDWETIVAQLVFKNAKTGELSQIYDTSHLFVLGDLNYRISRETPNQISLNQISEWIDKSDANSLLKHDQLRQEQRNARTLQGLAEGQISFLPTYKYKVGTGQYKDFKHRIPSYCDRILHASTQTTLRVLSYSDVPSLKRSDHKPVVATYELGSLDSVTSSPRKLEIKAPYPVDSQYWLKGQIGNILDRFVGSVWQTLVIAGFGSDKLGLLVVIGVLACFAGHNHGYNPLSLLKTIVYDSKGKLE